MLDLLREQTGLDGSWRVGSPNIIISTISWPEFHGLVVIFYFFVCGNWELFCTETQITVSCERSVENEAVR